MASVDPSTYEVDPGHGWIMFAGVLLALVGVLNVIHGIAAIGNSHLYTQHAHYVIGNLHTWGWFRLITGVAQLIAAYGIFTATEWGRWLGVIIAGLNMIVQFIALPSAPGQALIMFFVDVIVIYGLLTYGGRDRHSLADWN